jgi:RNA polymerase sigma factor (sigma-70 family)
MNHAKGMILRPGGRPAAQLDHPFGLARASKLQTGGWTAGPRREAGLTLEALRRGEPEVLADLLDQHGRQIQGVAYLILRDRQAAEDVLMDTLIAALDRGSTLREASAMRPWLLRIATNLALGKRRRERRVTWVQLLPDTPAPQADDTDRLALLAGLNELPARTRAAVVLHYYADLSVADVAAAMGTSQNTVKTQLRTALEKLRAVLAPAQNTAVDAEVVRG